MWGLRVNLFQRQPIPAWPLVRWEKAGEAWDASTRPGGVPFARVSKAFVCVLGKTGGVVASFIDNALSLSIDAPFLAFNELCHLRVAKAHTKSELLLREEGSMYGQTIKICADAAERVFKKLWKSAPRQARVVLSAWLDRIERLKECIPEAVMPKYDGFEVRARMGRALPAKDFARIPPLLEPFGG
ncbi:MAG: hypothetical protein QXH27_00140 [Candidatus Micrarchaeia archaeon]